MTLTATPGRVSGRRWWLVIGSIFAVLVLAAGTASAASWLARQSQTQKQTYHHRVARVVINSGTGDIRVSPGADAMVAITRHLVWSFGKPRVTEAWDGDTLRVTTRCPEISLGAGCRVDLTLAVPPNTAIEASSGTGDIHVSGAQGTLSLESGTGDIDTTGLACAEVRARAGTGNIVLRFATAPRQVSASAGTGDVRIRLPAGTSYRVSSQVGTGDQRIRLTRDPAADRQLVLDAGTGDVDAAYG
ncbi:MAG TPA: DUF4097 family beta strand repeat-containing protein [Micromonosporaceae bacterium]|jgi:hypothetical protein